MKKGHECALKTMTPNNWLELELLWGINDQRLQKRLLQERNPTLKDMVLIATAWQSVESMAQLCFGRETHHYTWPKQDKENIGRGEETIDFDCKKMPDYKRGKQPLHPQRQTALHRTYHPDNTRQTENCKRSHDGTRWKSWWPAFIWEQQCTGRTSPPHPQNE